MVASDMKRKHLNNAEGYIRKDNNKSIDPDLSGYVFNFGDVAWVRTGSYTWWPAQVIDEKSIGPSSKPRKKTEFEVLIRLYGTYNFLYIDPVKNSEEFENTMKQKNSSIRDMLEKALEEGLSCNKVSQRMKRSPSPSKEHVTAGVSRDVEMQDKFERNEETNSVVFVGASLAKDTDRGTNCIEDIEKARNVGSKSNNSKKHYLRKKQLRQRDRCGTLEDMSPEGESRTHCSKGVDKASDIDCGGKKLKKNFNRKQPVTGKSRDRTLKNLHQDEVKAHQGKEKAGSKVRQNQDGKRKTEQQSSSERRIKVMQSLALIAPSGSPFCRNGLVKAASQKS